MLDLFIGHHSSSFLKFCPSYLTMHLLWIFDILQLHFILFHCQLFFIWRDNEISYISYVDVTTNRSAIKCLKNSLTSSRNLNWIDEKGMFQQMVVCMSQEQVIQFLSIVGTIVLHHLDYRDVASHNVTLHSIYIYIGNGSEKFG